MAELTQLGNRVVTRRTMIGRGLGGGVLAGLVGTALVGCGASSASPASGSTANTTTNSANAASAARPAVANTAVPAKAASGTVTWFMRASGVELQWEQAAVKAFQAANANVKVDLVTVGSSKEFDPKLTALIAGGTAPDVWTHWGESGFGDYYAKGLIADLTSLASADKLDSSTFLPNTYDAWKLGGKLYGLSFNQRFGTFVFYNKQLFEQAGVPTPPADWEDKSWTWDKMVEAAQKITKSGAGSNQFGVAFGAQPGLWGLAYLFGGDFFTKEHYQNGVAKASNMGTPEVKASMEARYDLMHKLRVYPTPADDEALGTGSHTKQFTDGKLAMLMDTGSEWPKIDDANKDGNLSWGVAAVPRQKDNRVINFINPLMLSKDSKNKDASWAFMKWTVGTDGQKTLVDNNFQPVNKALLDDYLKSTKPQQSAADVKKVVEGAAPHGQISPNQLFVDFGLVRTAVDEAMAPAWKGDKSAADALLDAKTKVDAILAASYDKYGKK